MLLHFHTSHHKRASSLSYLHVKRGVPASENGPLIVVAILLTVAIVLFLLALIMAVLSHRRKSKNKVSDPKLKPLQLVVIEGTGQIKYNDHTNKPLSVPVELAKPTREYYIGESKPLIFSSTDLKV
jgi:hypothetical protein